MLPTYSIVETVLVAQSCPTLCDPTDCSPLGSSVHGILQARSGLPSPSPGDLPNPGIESGSPTLQADALPSELPEKPLFVRSDYIIIPKLKIIFFILLRK